MYMCVLRKKTGKLDITSVYWGFCNLETGQCPVSGSKSPVSGVKSPVSDGTKLVHSSKKEESVAFTPHSLPVKFTMHQLGAS
jgi:hypothetical protein